MDAVQVETPVYIVQNSNVTIVKEYAGALARSIVRFLRLYYNNDQDQGRKTTAMRAPTLCSRPLYRLGIFFSCLLCPGSYPSQIVYCNRQQWRQTYHFNAVNSVPLPSN